MSAAQPLKYQIAQANVARLRAPLDDPKIAGFVSRLDDINALADAAPGFVWRLQTEAGNSTSVRAFEDDRILFNLSVWETPDHWRAFVFRGKHAEVMRQRGAWFERMDSPYLVMWWVAAGHHPSVAEALERLEHLRACGDSPFAFSFTRLYPPPGGQE